MRQRRQRWGRGPRDRSGTDTKMPDPAGIEGTEPKRALRFPLRSQFQITFRRPPDCNPFQGQHLFVFMSLLLFACICVYLHCFPISGSKYFPSVLKLRHQRGARRILLGGQRVLQPVAYLQDHLGLGVYPVAYLHEKAFRRLLVV